MSEHFLSMGFDALNMTNMCIFCFGHYADFQNTVLGVFFCKHENPLKTLESKFLASINVILSKFVVHQKAFYE